MISDKRLKANRLNALRHGLTGQVAAMTGEDRAAHARFSKTPEYQPTRDGFVFSNSDFA